jgi:hypothetical protein
MPPIFIQTNQMRVATTSLPLMKVDVPLALQEQLESQVHPPLYAESLDHLGSPVSHPERTEGTPIGFATGVAD